MRLILILSAPSRSIYYELEDLFSNKYKILYLPELIKKSQFNTSALLKSIQLGNNLKKEDISNLIYSSLSEEKNSDYILLTGFPRNLAQVTYFKSFLLDKEIDFELISVINTSKDDLSFRNLFINHDKFIEISKISDLVDQI